MVKLLRMSFSETYRVGNRNFYVFAWTLRLYHSFQVNFLYNRYKWRNDYQNNDYKGALMRHLPDLKPRTQLRHIYGWVSDSYFRSHFRTKTYQWEHNMKERREMCVSHDSPTLDTRNSHGCVQIVEHICLEQWDNLTTNTKKCPVRTEWFQNWSGRNPLYRFETSIIATLSLATKNTKI